jgi:hypothetical protein
MQLTAGRCSAQLLSSTADTASTAHVWFRLKKELQRSSKALVVLAGASQRDTLHPDVHTVHINQHHEMYFWCPSVTENDPIVTPPYLQQ